MPTPDAALFESALASTRDGVVIAEAGEHDNPIVYTNPAFREITGYTEEEIVGRDCRFLQGEQMDRNLTDQIRKAIDQGKPIRVTLRNFRKDGRLFWNELSISPITNSAGKLTHFVGIQKDVTERVELQEKLAAANRRQETLLAKLEEQNKRDALTGLYNRRALDEEASILWGSLQRMQAMVAVLFIDIDHFKSINDSYGHRVGDACLTELGSILKGQCERNSDLLVRYGGEEFVVISVITSQDTAAKLAENIRQTTKATLVEIDNPPVRVQYTLSIGVASCHPGPKDTLDTLIHAADEAMYEAKIRGRDQVVCRQT